MIENLAKSKLAWGRLSADKLEMLTKDHHFTLKRMLDRGLRRHNIAVYPVKEGNAVIVSNVTTKLTHNYIPSKTFTITKENIPSSWSAKEKNEGVSNDLSLTFFIFDIPYHEFIQHLTPLPDTVINYSLYNQILKEKGELSYSDIFKNPEKYGGVILNIKELDQNLKKYAEIGIFLDHVGQYTQATVPPNQKISNAYAAISIRKNLEEARAFEDQMKLSKDKKLYNMIKAVNDCFIKNDGEQITLKKQNSQGTFKNEFKSSKIKTKSKSLDDLD